MMLSDEGHDEMMITKDIGRFSLYKHHLTPFFCKSINLQLFYGKDVFLSETWMLCGIKENKTEDNSKENKGYIKKYVKQ